MNKSLLKAIDVMELFGEDHSRLSLAQISQELGMPKSTAHNILDTLRHRGYIEKVDDDNYALGRHIVALGSRVLVNLEVRDRAAPLLRELADACRDSVYLAVPDGDRCLFLYGVESSHRLIARTAMGARVHMHCTGVGKAMLAFMPADRQRDILDRAGMPAFTENTLTDRQKLHEQLDAIRIDGYATDCGEHEVGVYCIAAPIFDSRGRVAASCSFAAPDPEVVTSRMRQIASCVTYTALGISHRLGYVLPRAQVQSVEQDNPLDRYRSETRLIGQN